MQMNSNDKHLKGRKHPGTVLETFRRGPDCIQSSHLSYGIHSAQSDNPKRNRRLRVFHAGLNSHCSQNENLCLHYVHKTLILLDVVFGFKKAKRFLPVLSVICDRCEVNL